MEELGSILMIKNYKLFELLNKLKEEDENAGNPNIPYLI